MENASNSEKLVNEIVPSPTKGLGKTMPAYGYDLVSKPYLLLDYIKNSLTVEDWAQFQGELKPACYTKEGIPCMGGPGNLGFSTVPARYARFSNDEQFYIGAEMMKYAGSHVVLQNRNLGFEEGPVGLGHRNYMTKLGLGSLLETFQDIKIGQTKGFDQRMNVAASNTPEELTVLWDINPEELVPLNVERLFKKVLAPYRCSKDPRTEKFTLSYFMVWDICQIKTVPQMRRYLYCMTKRSTHQIYAELHQYLLEGGVLVDLNTRKITVGTTNPQE